MFILGYATPNPVRPYEQRKPIDIMDFPF